ncbi:uncharacterized protein K452DRAFT_283581 [Aplosporella prunicola CBS 121167]|uniref:Uncharacterized protein n=1 Tax=Aplosporella prunicola CBS 121167 TaxID=1176127 RepID=A0A6A6BQ97_9PEZI|nr:uncharacterized protein K452DRAFT_283581 [Aplosporella prunicola CBS 121167]KAF2146302.1 hypothetical protein K452DRAFT_283581 [Aplosporella prunicola CBS 121167]
MQQQQQSAPAAAAPAINDNAPLAPEPLTLFPTDRMQANLLVSTLPLSPASPTDIDTDTDADAAPRPTRWAYLPQLQPAGSSSSSLLTVGDAASYLPASVLGGAEKTPAPPKHEKGRTTALEPAPTLVRELESTETAEGVKTGTAATTTTMTAEEEEEEEEEEKKTSSSKEAASTSSSSATETGKPAKSATATEAAASSPSSAPLEAAESTAESTAEAAVMVATTSEAASETAAAAPTPSEVLAESTAEALELSPTPTALSESEAEASLAVDALGLRPQQRWWANGMLVVR